MQMSTPAPDQSLHLPSLVIKNFRGIDELTIPRLGRVTLLAGKNGVGKTTVLDALRIYADLGFTDALIDVLYGRDEVFTPPNESKNDAVILNWGGLFYGRPYDPVEPIKIGPVDGGDLVQIRFASLGEDEIPDAPQIRMMLTDGGIESVLEVAFGDSRRNLIHRRLPIIPSELPRVTDRMIAAQPYPYPIACEILGPDVPSNTIFWATLRRFSFDAGGDKGDQGIQHSS